MRHPAAIDNSASYVHKSLQIYEKFAVNQSVYMVIYPPPEKGWESENFQFFYRNIVGCDCKKAWEFHHDAAGILDTDNDALDTFERTFVHPDFLSCTELG